jgi:hypothetical protein
MDSQNPPSSALPQLMTSMAERIAEAVSSLQPRTPDAVPEQNQMLAGLDRPAVISILGDPGSGKSTVLDYAREVLVRDGHRLVLPTLTPERFAIGDTLFGWTLAALQDEPRLNTPAAAEFPVETRGKSRSLRESLDLLRRQEALAASGAKARPASEALTPDTLAVHLAAVTSSGIRLARGWWDLVNSLVSSSFAEAVGGTVRQVVIMLDDADRSPSVAPSLLADLRWLTVHPAVAVVLCGSETVLLELVSETSELHMLPASLRQRYATDTLVKAIPRHLRHKLRELDSRERLPYRSLDSGEAIRDVLAAIAMPSPAPVGVATLLDYFELSVFGNTTLSHYAKLLPGNARRLDQVNRGLRAVVTRGGDTIAGEAAIILAESAFSVARAQNEATPEGVVLFTQEGAEPGITLDVTALRASQLNGTGVRLLSNDTKAVGVRRHRAFTVHVVTEDDGRIELPEAFAYGLEFIKEVSDSGSLPTPAVDFFGQSGALPKPGGHNWLATLDVALDGEPTDNGFLLLPDWDDLTDYSLYVNAWNAIVDELASDSTFYDDPISITWLTFTHIGLVIAIQTTRRVPASLFPEGVPPWATWSVDDAEAELRDSLRRTYSRELKTIRDGDFNTWLYAYLPWSADPAFGSTELGDRIMRLRADAIDDSQLPAANALCARSLYDRLQRHLGEKWIEGTIELLSDLDSNTGREIRTMHDITHKDRNRTVQGLLDALQQRGVPEDLLGRLALQGLTPKTAAGLQELGLPRQVIAQLAEQFPPVVAAEDESLFPTDRR